MPPDPPVSALLAEIEQYLAKITPGEWYADNPAVRWRILSRLPTGDVHYVMEGYPRCHEVRREADAQFIAAAPRLLRALATALQGPQEQEKDLARPPAGRSEPQATACHGGDTSTPTFGFECWDGPER